jgi:hypothetical protein
MANIETLRPIAKGQRTKEEQKIFATKGGIASGKARKQNKTIAEILKTWTENELKNTDRKKLEELGIYEETNKALLVLPLIKQISKGDTKALNLAIELLREDKEKEARIKKLELENERLRKEINGELVENKVIVLGDIPKEV